MEQWPCISKSRHTVCVKSIGKAFLSIDQDARSEPLGRKHTNFLLKVKKKMAETTT